MSKVKVTQIRSLAGREPTQHKAMACLGLGRIGKSREFTINKALAGVLKKVEHLVKIEAAK